MSFYLVQPELVFFSPVAVYIDPAARLDYIHCLFIEYLSLLKHCVDGNTP